LILVGHKLNSVKRNTAVRKAYDRKFAFLATEEHCSVRFGSLPRMCRDIHLPSIHHDTRKQTTIMAIALTSIIQRGYKPSHIKVIVSCVPSPEGFVKPIAVAFVLRAVRS